MSSLDLRAIRYALLQLGVELYQWLTFRQLAVSFGEHTSKDVLVAYRYARLDCLWHCFWFDCYRIGGLDWEFSNVTANSAYQFVEPGSSALNETEYTDHKTFELRGMLIKSKIIRAYTDQFSDELGLWISFAGSTWCSLLTIHTVQIDSVYVASDARLVKAAEFNRTVEIIGDSWVCTHQKGPTNFTDFIDLKARIRAVRYLWGSRVVGF